MIQHTCDPVHACINDTRHSYACTGGMLATVCCCIICVTAVVWSGTYLHKCTAPICMCRRYACYRMLLYHIVYRMPLSRCVYHTVVGYGYTVRYSISLDKHVGARMPGIFRARAMRGVLKPYLVHACPMLDDTTILDRYQHTIVRVWNTDGIFRIRCAHLQICYLCARSYLKTVDYYV